MKTTVVLLYLGAAPGLAAGNGWGGEARWARWTRPQKAGAHYRAGWCAHPTTARCAAWGGTPQNTGVTSVLGYVPAGPGLRALPLGGRVVLVRGGAVVGEGAGLSLIQLRVECDGGLWLG